MKKIIITLLFLAGVAHAQQTPPYTAISSSPYYWKLPGAFDYLSLPRGCDTATAWHPVQTRRAGAIFVDTCLAKAFIWYGYWKEIGSASISENIYTSDGTIDSIRTITIPYGYRISWLANGGTYGQDSQKPPFWHFAGQDTITNNTYSSGGAAAIWERNTLFTTNRRQYHKGYDFINRWFASDSARVESVGGDYAYNVRFERKLSRASTNTNRSVFTGATTDWDAAPNIIAWDVHSRPAGHSASQRSRGWWAGISSYPIMNANTDTLDYWIGYISMSRITPTNKILKYIDYWAGGGSYSDGRVDSIFGFYSRYANVRNHFAGPTGFGLNNTGATANVDILGTLRLREGNQGAGKVLTSDANGWATWQTPASSGLFGRTDSRNNTGAGLSFSNAGQDYSIDSIGIETRNYVEASGRTGSLYVNGNTFGYESTTGSVPTGIFADGGTGIQIYHTRNSDSRSVSFTISDDINFKMQYGGPYSLKASSLTPSMRFLARDSITGIIYDYTGSVSGSPQGIDSVLSTNSSLSTNRTLDLNGSNFHLAGGGYFRVYNTAGSNRLLEVDGTNQSGFIGRGTGQRFSFSDSIGLQSIGQVIDTTVWKPVIRNSGTGMLAYAPWMYAGGGGGSSSISSLTAAASANTIDNANNKQEWQWSTLSGTGLKLSSISTAAASNLQKILEITSSGANSTSGQITYGLDVSNTHTGTTSLNIGIQSTASGATNNRPFNAIATESNSTPHYYLQGSGSRAGWIGLGASNSFILTNTHASDNAAGFSFRNRTSTEILAANTTAVYAPFSLIVNDAGGNFDSRIEGDNDANLFFTDASADAVGIGTATPGHKLDINGMVNTPGTEASTYRWNAAASETPATTSFATPTNYYGSNITNVLGTPHAWLRVNVGGTFYIIPAYTPFVP